MAKEFEPAGGRVLGISEDLFVPGSTKEGALAAVEKVVATRDIRFPVLIMEGELFEQLNQRLGLPGPIPCTLAFDKNGVEVDREEGGCDAARFRQMLRRALGTEPPAGK